MRSNPTFLRFVRTYGLTETKARQMLAEAGLTKGAHETPEDFDPEAVAQHLGLSPSKTIGERAQQVYPDMKP